MELGLSLGSEFMSKSGDVIPNKGSLGFSMGLSISPNNCPGKLQVEDEDPEPEEEEEEDQAREKVDNKGKHSQEENNKSSQQSKRVSDHLLMESDDKISPIQLDLLPNTPVPRNHHHHHNSLLIPWPSDNGKQDPNRERLENHHLEEVVGADQDRSSSPQNSAASSFQMDFSLYSNKFASGNEGDHDNHRRSASSRASDEDENGTRKKLRLSKEQSAFLEESFKEHSTLNPKQKLALAKQLNLRPRQVEVWFQNRRARTKLKQIEVDCEYLKRCCETLTEENRRLHKELQELRVLKPSSPCYKQLPATSLTMCPSCEKVATTTNNNNNGSASSDPTSKARGLQLARPRLIYPFPTQKSTPTTSPQHLEKTK